MFSSGGDEQVSGSGEDRQIFSSRGDKQMVGRRSPSQVSVIHGQYACLEVNAQNLMNPSLVQLTWSCSKPQGALPKAFKAR